MTPLRRLGALVDRCLRPSWAPAVVWTLYVVIPVAGWGILAGRPLGPLAAAALAVVWWGWGFGRRAPLPLAVAVLVVVKLVAGETLLLERGFRAWYYANDGWQGPAERSTDFPGLRVTRIDPEIDFGRRSSFPLYFFNDNRFNYYQPTEPVRTRLAFSVRWDGWIHVPGDGQYTVVLARTAPAKSRSRKQPVYLAAAEADCAIDGRPVAALGPNATGEKATVPVAPGWHRLEIRYRSPYGADRAFSASIVEDGAGKTATPQVYGRPAPPWRIQADRAVRLGSSLVDVLLLALLGLWAMRAFAASLARVGGWWRQRDQPFPRPAALAATALLVLAALWFRSRRLAGVVLTLSGGNDWLTYETYARDIGLNGPLMILGRPIGQGDPFQYQPLYSYFLAATHWLFGEDFWGVYFCQDLLFAGAIWAIFTLTAELFGAPASWVSGALAVYFRLTMSLNPRPSAPTDAFLSESLFIPLLAFWALLLVRLPVRRPGWLAAAATGVLGGVATLTRSTLLLGLPLVLGAVAWSWRRHRPRAWVAPFTVFTVCLGATIGLATIRNAVVSGQFALVVANSGPINLLISNEPPEGFDAEAAARRPLYRRLGLDARTAQVVEYAWQMPGAFTQGLASKLAYSLGLTRTGVQPEFLILVWASALLGIALVARTPAVRRDPLSFVPALLAVAHLVVLVVIGVFTYGYRLVYPMYVMLFPYSALALVWIGKQLGLPSRDRGDVL